ncbi:DUF4062 domain-containing protein [Ancylobacter sp. SL191]|uniref:DUF4062 domain-containing protein n=1 Tax=Ancylobacter sp. SL191 TaxID=2995166 RepID=UPI00226E057C|nr:DUF4062 domain-containing protein [Ancylobacter sp. SL191]WAC27346.1 DUF4062 domain-containing protein [Ancylobacter sp. SL191]
MSSTYYDLKHIRSSIEAFISNVGYDAVLSERGLISYNPDSALDESCYREAASADIFVLIIGGRYGSASSGDGESSDKKFFDSYDSVTKQEYEHARLSGVPIYVLIENSVYIEHRTYLSNKDNQHIKYVSVDSVNVFKLIDYILAQPRNNPVFSFSNYSEIENWLREQWAGMFREFLRSRSQLSQISELSKKINDLEEINNTLKVYLEKVLSNVDSKGSAKLIQDQNRRIEEEKIQSSLKDNKWIKFVSDKVTHSYKGAVEIVKSSNSVDELRSKIVEILHDNGAEDVIDVVSICWIRHGAQEDFDNARIELGLKPIFRRDDEFHEANRLVRGRRRRRQENADE